MRERGSIAVLAAIWMLVAVALLGTIDIGNVFFVRRNLQGVADMAAIAAAQRMDALCQQPATAANANATANGFDPTQSGNTLAISCLRWDPQYYGSPSYYGTTSTPLNAAQVTVTQNVPYFFFGPNRQVQAVSTARAVNTDQFTLGTTLANVQNGLVNNLLGPLLGVSLNLSAASYTALVNTQVTVQDLVVAAGVGSLSQLLALQVSTAKFMQILLNAVTRTQVLNTSLQAGQSALSTLINANIPGGTVNIGNLPGQPGVLALALSNTQSAVNTQVNVFDMVMVAAEVAAAGKPAVNLGTQLQLGLLTSSLQVQIIQPPVVAVGEDGINPATGTWRTQANTADVRLYLNVNLGTTNLSATGVLAPLLLVIGNIIPISVNLPLSLEAVPGYAWLQSTNCAPTAAASTAVIGVQPGLANLCIGNQPANPSANQPFSCSTPATLVSVSVLTIPVLQVMANVALPAVVPAANSTTLTFNGITGDADDYQTSNSNAVGSVLTNALQGAAQALTAPNGLTLYVLGLGVPVGSVLGPLVSLLTTVLSPLLSSLDQVVMPLLNLLGAQVGIATVHNEALTCGAAQTVY
ncbi:TadG family pilus assembly protein [Burkholderia alba]|uniref:TadG family pilus assembly protein n=1 Tax=Burkholderia alba TaxID=2683677 RepID=UPI002B05D946|nr:TadG family pilus assembly protein [Burkholderia alba]